MELTTRGPLQQAGHLAGQLNTLGHDIRVCTRVGSQQGRGVRMARPLVIIEASLNVFDGEKPLYSRQWNKRIARDGI